jgi:hypothetical protein
MTDHGIGFHKAIYHKSIPMKKSLIIFGFFFPSVVFGQVGDFFWKMPLKYETPYPGMSTSVTTERGENIWYVIAAKDNIPVYSDQSCQMQKGTERFLQYFAVWQEDDDAVRLVKNRGTATLTENYKFNSNALDVGWVKKKDLVLWNRYLAIDKVPVRAIIRKTPDNRTLPSNMPGFNKHIADSSFDIYFVWKQEPDAWLLSITDLVHGNLTNNDVFWVKRSDITTISSTKGFVPDWKKVLEGQRLYTFSDRKKTGVSDTSGAAFKIYRNNPHLGYFYFTDDQKTAKVFNPLAFRADTQYLNLSDARFLKANLVDNIQLTSLKVFAKILSESPLKQILQSELKRYFGMFDTTSPKVKTMNLAELLGHSLGIDFSGYSAMEIVPVNEIKDIDYDTYFKTFSENFDKLDSEKEIEKYRFYSGMAYCWLPQNLLSLDILSGLTLFKKKSIVIRGNSFKEYNIVYIDHSAQTEEKSFEQLQAEILKLYRTLKPVWTAENQSNDIGDLLYFSSGVDPIMSGGEPTFEQISGQMRNSSTVRPDHFNDKLRLENRLFGGVKVVSDKINIYFSVSDNFYRSELEGRAFFLKEFVERIDQILATDNTKVIVNLLYNNPKNSSRESELKSYCKNMSMASPNVKYEVITYK